MKKASLILPLILTTFSGLFFLQYSHAGEPEFIEFVNTDAAPEGLPFPAAVRVGGMLYLSGHLGNVPGSMVLVPGGIKAEARQTMENIRVTLQAQGYDMKDLVKCTVMLADISEWKAFNEVYKTFFDGPYPARSAFGAGGLALDARVEVECIAAKTQ